MAHLAFIFCCLVWGSSFILLERVTHVFGPVEIALWRLFAGAAVVGLCWWHTCGSFRLRPRDCLHLTFCALAFTAPPLVIQAYLLTQGHGHSFFGTMVAAIPLLTILVSIPMLGQLPTARELAGVLGGLACLWLMVEEGVDRGMSLLLLGLTLLVPLSSAISNTFIKWKLQHVPAAPLTASLLVVAGVGLMPLEFSPSVLSSLHITGPANAALTAEAVFYLFLLGVVASGISTMVFIWLILKKGPLYAGMTTYVVPVLALLWGTVDRERISGQQMIAIAGVLSMVALVQSGSQSATAAPPELEPYVADDPDVLVVPASKLPMPEPALPQPESQVA